MDKLLSELGYQSAFYVNDEFVSVLWEETLTEDVSVHFVHFVHFVPFAEEDIRTSERGNERKRE